MINKILNNIINKKALEVIIRAETSAEPNGISVFELIFQYSRELIRTEKKVAQKLSAISRRLENGEKRWIVYKGILDKDILKLLSVAHEKSLPSSVIFSNYAPVKSITEKNLKAIKRSFFMPIGVFVLLSIVFSFVIKGFKDIGTIGDSGLSNLSLRIIDNYLYINSGILLVIIYLFFAIPDKLPMLKKIYLQLKSIMILSTISVMSKVGYPSGEIIPIIAKQYGLKRKKGGEDSKALSEMLLKNKIISPFESADLKIGINFGELENSLQSILEQRMEDIDSLKKMVDEAVKNITLILTAIPVLLALVVFKDVMAIATSLGG